ncbi:DUF6191 domain-containing protein [Streptacidiphilus carbonis]|uniref:DUF6191 domain-containing protein n=1 Tax=Streptacidiphilus carbonis TaxID=105422 RepID=UPI001F2651BA|nr:DUF6191 domain-containing protein [Streptacidiphilus carbonis]
MPSSRYREEERNRLEWTRDDEGEGDPYRGPIDLDGGKVVVRLPVPPDGDEAE